MPTAATKRLRSARQPGRRLPTASTTYVALDCPQRALAAIEHAVAIYRTQGDRHGLCYALFNMAICCDALRETARKAVIYEEQLPLARAVGDVQLETVVLSQLGHTYAKLGIASRGLAYFDQAIALLEQQGVRAGQYTILGAAAALHLAEGNYQAAAACYRRQIQLAGELGDYQLEAAAWQLLATAKPST